MSVASNIALVAFKLAAWAATGSVSVLSEAAHSAMDLLAAGIAWFAVVTAAKPADREHGYGHAKIENFSALLEAALIFAAALWIIVESVHKLQAPKPLSLPGMGAAVMLVSAAVNWAVSRMLFKVGTREQSPALIADAWHLRTDVYTSAGVMFALAAYAVGEKFFHSHDLAWMDPVAAIAVALLITRAAWDLTVQALGDLLDASLPEDEVAEIERIVAAMRPGIASHKNLKTRKSGRVRYISLDALVDGNMTVAQAHAIADRLETELETRFPHARVTVHIEPAGGHQ